MTTTHTPGPWKIIKGDFVVAPDNGTVAQVGTPTTPAREHEANARLIAAAPEMLEALRDMVLHEGEREVDGIGLEHESIALEQAKALARTILDRIDKGGAK